MRRKLFGGVWRRRLRAGAAGVGGNASENGVWRLGMTAGMAGRGLLATCIMSGIDAMCVRLSLSHSQKGVQVYATQIMLCDKRQFSWRRGSSPARCTNDRLRYTPC